MKANIQIIGFCLCCVFEISAAEIVDDFSMDSGRWKWSKGGGKGAHTVQNGRLEFSTNSAATTNDSATHYLKAPVGSYADSWEAQSDVYLGPFALGGKNPYAGLALLVGNASRPARDFVRVQLRKGSDEKRAFNADAYLGPKHLGSEWLDSTSSSATLKIAFDGKTKVLTASYDSDGISPATGFVSFFSLNIGSGPDAWKMKDTDIFEFSLVSQATGSIVSFGDMFFDNVMIRNLGH